MKRGGVCFNPVEPPPVMPDPVDVGEQPEPTPLVPCCSVVSSGFAAVVA